MHADMVEYIRTFVVKRPRFGAVEESKADPTLDEEAKDTAEKKHTAQAG